MLDWGRGEPPQAASRCLRRAAEGGEPSSSAPPCGGTMEITTSSLCLNVGDNEAYLVFKWRFRSLTGSRITNFGSFLVFVPPAPPSGRFSTY